MRIHIITGSSEKVLPFNYQTILTGAFHKWIGRNNMHGDVSLYSFSWLQGGKATGTGLKFPNGASFFISAFDNELLKKIISGIHLDPTIANGLTVKEVIIQGEPTFDGEVKLACASPIFIKRLENNRVVHYTYCEEESGKYLTETLKTKLRVAGLDDNNVSVDFDTSYLKAKTKTVYYNKVGNKVNVCPVIVRGSQEQIQFAWNVGVGNCTGIGFGALN